MYQVSVETHFSAAHRLKNYKGLCENLHGHNWKVEATVCSRKLDQAGMVMDFNVLKHKINAVVDLLDHQYLNEIDPFRDRNPSSELLAAYIFDQLSIALQDTAVTLVKVSVWESDRAQATYIP